MLPGGRSAISVYKALTKDLENPIGGSAEFRTAFQNAAKTTKTRLNNLEYFNAGKTLDQLQGADVAAQDRFFETLGTKGDAPARFVNTIKQNFDPEKMQGLQSTYIDKLFRSGAQLRNRGWTEAEEAFLSQRTRDLLQDNAYKLSKVDGGEISKSLESSLSRAGEIQRLIFKTPPSELRTTLKAAGISEESYQASIFADVLNKVVRNDKGDYLVDAGRLDTVVRDLRSVKNAERWNLLSPIQRRFLTDVTELNAFIKNTGSNIATSLQTATIQANLTSANPAKMIGAATDMARFWALSAVLSNKGAARSIENLKAAPTLNNKVRASVIGISTLLDELRSGSYTPYEASANGQQ
jgi:hypothetical protein